MQWPSRTWIGEHWQRLTAAGARGPADSTPAATTADHTGPLPRITYSPKADGQPDAGEVVWTWVPFQDDPSRGKDRPVLLIAQDGAGWLALPMTSKDHDRDAAQERAAGRIWVDVGSGAWDSRGRPSEVGVHRVLRVNPSAIRRQGAILDPEPFAAVVAALVGVHGEGTGPARRSGRAAARLARVSRRPRRDR